MGGEVLQGELEISHLSKSFGPLKRKDEIYKQKLIDGKTPSFY